MDIPDQYQRINIGSLGGATQAHWFVIEASSYMGVAAVSGKDRGLVSTTLHDYFADVIDRWLAATSHETLCYGFKTKLRQSLKNLKNKAVANKV